MTDAPDAGRLAINARAHRYDPRLDHVADAMERGDVGAWQSLPNKVIGEASIYLDFRNSYRAAVRAGVIPDDRSGPSAA